MSEQKKPKYLTEADVERLLERERTVFRRALIRIGTERAGTAWLLVQKFLVTLEEVRRAVARGE